MSRADRGHAPDLDRGANDYGSLRCHRHHCADQPDQQAAHADVHRRPGPARWRVGHTNQDGEPHPQQHHRCHRRIRGLEHRQHLRVRNDRDREHDDTARPADRAARANRWGDAFRLQRRAVCRQRNHSNAVHLYAGDHGTRVRNRAGHGVPTAASGTSTYHAVRQWRSEFRIRGTESITTGEIARDRSGRWNIHHQPADLEQPQARHLYLRDGYAAVAAGAHGFVRRVDCDDGSRACRSHDGVCAGGCLPGDRDLTGRAL